jgi:hypothetical protein
VILRRATADRRNRLPVNWRIGKIKNYNNEGVHGRTAHAMLLECPVYVRAYRHAAVIGSRGKQYY